MDLLMDATKKSHEPEWLETLVVGEIRVWQIIFLCLSGVTALIVMVCCCFRFRIPRTKQQIEADYQRRKITVKFRHQLEALDDAKMDAMSLKDALELIHEKVKPTVMEAENQQGCQPRSVTPPQQNSLNASYHAEGPQKPEPQVSGMNFAKFATKVAHLSKLAQPKSPTSPTPSDNKMNF